jgi:hypothetical protein
VSAPLPFGPSPLSGDGPSCVARKLAGRSAVFQRNPAGVLAVVIGVATDVTGAVGGVVVVTVAGGADLTVSVPACSLATATAPMTTTALAPITADSNLTFFCWSTLTTPFGPQAQSAASAKRPFEGEGAQFIRLLP